MVLSAVLVAIVASTAVIAARLHSSRLQLRSSRRHLHSGCQLGPSLFFFLAGGPDESLPREKIIADTTIKHASGGAITAGASLRRPNLLPLITRLSRGENRGKNSSIDGIDSSSRKEDDVRRCGTFI
ncbi:hypothetical protein NL676_001008 [Syzygium grande]|nr:hypothetical protein NL676_001008 [Syzygium grande]